MGAFYVLRYVDGTPLSKRYHRFTLGRYGSYAAADDALLANPMRDHLEVVERQEDRA